MSSLQKAGNSGYYELVTEQNAHYKKAAMDSLVKSKIIENGMEFQRGIPVNYLSNVDNGVSVFNGLNYDKLPHIVNWNLKNNSKKPIPLKAV